MLQTEASVTIVDIFIVQAIDTSSCSNISITKTIHFRSFQLSCRIFEHFAIILDPVTKLGTKNKWICLPLKISVSSHTQIQ